MANDSYGQFSKPYISTNINSNINSNSNTNTFSNTGNYNFGNNPISGNSSNTYKSSISY